MSELPEIKYRPIREGEKPELAPNPILDDLVFREYVEGERVIGGWGPVGGWEEIGRHKA